MKKIFRILVDFSKNDTRPISVVLTMLIIGLGIYINYFQGFRRDFLLQDYGSLLHYFKYFLFIALPYLVVLVIDSNFTKNFDWVQNKEFWIKIFVAFIILTINGSSKDLINEAIDTLNVEPSTRTWYYYLGTNIHRFLALGLLLYIFYYFFDGKFRNFYGVTTKNFSAKPYFMMLLIMLPLIIWASYQPSFMKTYPIYKPGLAETYGGYSHFITVGLFEFFYGLRFVVVEIFFRGFLVIGFVKILGSRAILPVVITYAFWHFGKPMAETIGSVFGGYILSIIALRTGSVVGGIIAHMGVALMMEAAAYGQLYLK